MNIVPVDDNGDLVGVYVGGRKNEELSSYSRHMTSRAHNINRLCL